MELLIFATGVGLGAAMGFLLGGKEKSARPVRGFVLLQDGAHVERELRAFQTKHGAHRGFFILGDGETAEAAKLGELSARYGRGVRHLSVQQGWDLMERLLSRGAVAEVYSPDVSKMTLK